MNSLQPQADQLIHQYTHLTGREARVNVYEFALFDFFRAGFTCDEFVMVVTFLMRENKRNKFQYSLKLGHLLNDHSRFMDFLGEAKAKDRNKVLPPTPRESVLQDFRRTSPEPTGAFLSAAEVISRLKAEAL